MMDKRALSIDVVGVGGSMIAKSSIVAVRFASSFTYEVTAVWYQVNSSFSSNSNISYASSIRCSISDIRDQQYRGFSSNHRFHIRSSIRKGIVLQSRSP